jgi:DnaJ-class molecular chaperone
MPAQEFPVDTATLDQIEHDEDMECTHCNGEGTCWEGSDPLGDCPDEPHRCHACNGSGNRRDQVIF